MQKRKRDKHKKIHKREEIQTHREAAQKKRYTDTKRHK